MHKGIAVSPGVAVGTAYCIREIFVNPDTKRLESDEVTRELEQYEAARDKAVAELRVMAQKVSEQVGNDAGQIFAVHESMLRDPAFTRRIRGWIVDERLTASAALHRLLEEFSALFARTRDEYLGERIADLRDVVTRLSYHLSDVLKPASTALPGPLIVIAEELLPSQAVALGNVDVRGIVNQGGSQTSHAAIIARGRGIPAVCGVDGILQYVKTGDSVIVDGRDGLVLVNPAPGDRQRLSEARTRILPPQGPTRGKSRPSRVTLDGEPVELLANINGIADAQAAQAMGATGIGLFRTEYLYLTHPTVPGEEEQLSIYRDIIEQSPKHQVTIRTLDIGGDKTVPYLGHTHQEANPFLGWRSIRLSFEHPQFFNTQLRAVLRAAARAEQLGGQVRLMFPMITNVEEMIRVKKMVHRVAAQLSREGQEFANVPLGMMLEVPAAAVMIRTLLRIVDFVSIGSNDLVQYLMAADRDNPKVSHLCQPLAPAVLRTLRHVIRACNKAQKPLTLCGEMAGQPRAFVLLLGMGLRSFSMSPSFIPSIKELAAHVSTADAAEILRQSAAHPADAASARIHGSPAQATGAQSGVARYWLIATLVLCHS